MYQEKLGRDFAYPEYKLKYPREPVFHLEHVKGEIWVYINKKKLEGIVENHISSKHDNLDFVEFDAKDMNIESVEVDNKTVEYHYDGDKVSVNLPKPLNKGEKAVVKVKYNTTPTKGFYFILPEENPGVDVPNAWTQGETEDNRYWLPTYDYPNNKSTSELIIHVPKGYTAVSNGKLIEKKEDEKWATWHWKMDVPFSTYLIAIAIGQFELIEEKWEDVDLQYYVPKGRKADAPRSFSHTKDVLKFFSEYTGVKYPYNKYAQACISEFTFGGMENITMTILTDITLHDEIAHMDYESEPLVSHEAAHQWFGDLVTMKDWGNIWLNESFATYFEALYMRTLKGDDHFTYEILRDLDSYLNEYSTRYARPIMARVYKYPMELFDSHSYPKGAVVLHSLREYLGDNVFRKALNVYLNRFKFKNAETEDFRKVLEEVSGEDLEWFFDQYNYNAGHPVLEVTQSWVAKDKMLKLTLSQKQADDSFSVYRLPLEVVIKLKDKGITRKLTLNQKELTLYIPLEDKPELVLVDPKFKVMMVLSYKYGAEDLMKMLKSEYVYARILAARGLAKFKSTRVVEALKKAILEDSFWGVGVEAANTLGKLNLTEAKNALLEVLEKAKNPRVRRAIARALGSYKEPEVGEALAKVLQNKKESYYVRQDAAISLGKTKWEKAYELLLKEIDTPSHNYAITIGVLRGLSELGTEDALKKVLEYANKSKPTWVYLSAVLALAKFPDKKEAQEKIIEGLKAEKFRVRVAAVMATKETMDSRYLPYLDNLTQTDLFERVRRLARDTAKKIRTQMEKGTEYKKLREEIEKIKEDNRKVLDTMTKLEAKG